MHSPPNLLKAKFLYVILTVLKLALYIRLSSNSEIHLCHPNARIKGCTTMPSYRHAYIYICVMNTQSVYA